MYNPQLSRREFLRRAAQGTAAIGATGGLAGILTLGTGCATNEVLLKKSPSKLTQKQKIEYIVQQQRNFNSYGGNLRQPLDYLGTGQVQKDLYDDGFTVGEHSFGTRLHADSNRNRLSYFSVFADNIYVGDSHGDGVDAGQIFAGNYHPVRGNYGNHVVREIPISENGSNPMANEFQNAVLDVIVEKYTTGAVSQETFNAFKTAKSNLLNSLK